EDGNVAAGFIPVSDANGLMTWTDPASISTGSIFANTSGVTSNENGNYALDDFVFGSPQFDYDGYYDHDSRMFFDKSKGAFRVGRANGTNWDTDSLGINSVAFGYNTKATGDYSTAMGRLTKATGYSSTAMGQYTDATGSNSTAMGYSTFATGNHTTAMGYTTHATGNYSTAMGMYTTATGYSSTAMGYRTEAKSGYETALGHFNTDYTPNDSTSGWDAADRLFVIGNGINIGATSDAMVVLKNGNTGFGTSTPDTTMHILGGLRYEDGNEAAGFIPVSDANGLMTWTDPDSISTGSIFELYGDTVRLDTSVVDIAVADFVFGSPQLDDDENADHDNRMFFDKSKGAFRAGGTTGTNWNTDSLGINSVAFGRDTKATGNYSTAMGLSTKATGVVSTAMGLSTTATGWYSTAMGYYTAAKSGSETTLGLYNTDYTPNDTAGWDAADRLFVIGNGTASNALSDAMVVLKNGNTGFGTSTP
ncbi:MAG: hypothetical protein GY732_15110, partial [Gammaproteobacteria bacterium]|nr:hypothetical protein [Gammaproteobacteria bacterium]